MSLWRAQCTILILKGLSEVAGIKDAKAASSVDWICELQGIHDMLESEDFIKVFSSLDCSQGSLPQELPSVQASGQEASRTGQVGLLQNHGVVGNFSQGSWQSLIGI